MKLALFWYKKKWHCSTHEGIQDFLPSFTTSHSARIWCSISTTVRWWVRTRTVATAHHHSPVGIFSFIILIMKIPYHLWRLLASRIVIVFIFVVCMILICCSWFLRGIFIICGRFSSTSSCPYISCTPITNIFALLSTSFWNIVTLHTALRIRRTTGFVPLGRWPRTIIIATLSLPGSKQTVIVIHWRSRRWTFTDTS